MPIFEVEFDGFRKELNLSAVPLDLKSEEVEKLDYTVFMRTLGQKAFGKGAIELEPSALEAYLDGARTALESQMELKLEELRKQNKYIIESKVNSLKKGNEVRLERLMKRLDNHIRSSQREGKSPSEEFIRMVNGQIEKDEKRTKDRIDRLQDKNDLILSVSLVGIALLMIGDE